MLTSILLVILILGLGAHLADGVRVRQEELILRKLTVEEAHGYYEVLRRRARRVRVLRAVTVASLLLGMLAARRRFFPPPPPPAPAATAGPTTVQAARSLADAAFARHAARESLDTAAFDRRDLAGDQRHPWAFEYRPRSGNAEVRRVYVDRAGQAEVHRVSRE
jgi:hypothetical protein